MGQRRRAHLDRRRGSAAVRTDGRCPLTRTYRLFGLNIASEFDLPGLPAGEGPVDAEICRAALAIEGREASPIRIGKATGFRIDGLGSFLVEDGKRILVDADVSQDERNVRLYLLGTAIGLLLLQRGDVPLHANAFVVDGRAVAVMGPSGSGKSTLAALAMDRGLPLLSDDVAVIRFGAAGPVVSRGLPRLRLWKDTLEARGQDAAGHSRAYLSGELWDKFDVAVDQIVADESPLEAIYLVEVGQEIDVCQVSGAEAAGLLIENVYRGEWANAHERAAIMAWAAALCRSVPLFRLTRPWDIRQAGLALDAIVQCERTQPDVLASRCNGN